MHYGEGRGTLGHLACASFQSTNSRDDPVINPCHNFSGLEPSENFAKLSVDLEAELSSSRGDLLIRGFREHVIDFFVGVRVCDTNQSSNQLRQPSDVIKLAKTEKKKKCLSDCANQ